MKQTILLLALLLSAQALAQRVPKEVAAALKGMRFIEGGTFIMGAQDEYEAPPRDTLLLLGDVERTVSISSFWMAEKEVTNAEWKAFYKAQVAALGETAAQKFLPDTLVWDKDFPYAYNEPITKFYFWHPAYSEYPVVGVSWEQAKAYCQWKTDEVNRLLEKSGSNLRVPAFRLPTEAEWEYAAKGVRSPKTDVPQIRIFPWEGNYLANASGKYMANFGSIRDRYGFSVKDYKDDGHAYTSKTGDYPANEWGLYDMAGNVREWVEDVARVMAFAEEDLNPYRPSRTASSVYASNANDTASFVQNVKTHYGDRDPAYVKAKAQTLWRSMQIATGDKRVVKGGSWADEPTYLLCASRVAFPAQRSSSTIGFRVAMISTGDAKTPLAAK